MHFREELYRERRNRVESVCLSARASKLWENEFVGKDFLIDLSNGLAYCRHGKVCKLIFLSIIQMDLKSRPQPGVLCKKNPACLNFPSLLLPTDLGSQCTAPQPKRNFSH